MTTEISTKNTNSIDPYVAEAAAVGGDYLLILKFSKAGDWIFGPDGDKLVGDQAAVNMATMQSGHICWKDNVIVTEQWSSSRTACRRRPRINCRTMDHTTVTTAGAGQCLSRSK